MKKIIFILILVSGFMFWKASRLASVKHDTSEQEAIDQETSVNEETKEPSLKPSIKATSPPNLAIPTKTATAADYARINAENLEKERIAREQADEQAQVQQNQYTNPPPEVPQSYPEVINQVEQYPQVQPETQLPQYNPNTGNDNQPTGQYNGDPNSNLPQYNQQMKIYDQQQPPQGDPNYQNPDAQPTQ